LGFGHGLAILITSDGMRIVFVVFESNDLVGMGGLLKPV
jgi:hypothetical protein